MGKRIVVSGTGTEVGKTWTAGRVAGALRQAGTGVKARKPVQSFEIGERTDAEVLAGATGEDPDVVCPPERSFALPLAPPMAAEALGAPPFSLQQLLDNLDLPQDGVCLIEGIGGPRSPLADDGDTVDLAAAIDADLVLLVADPGLGALNDVLLGVDAFAPRRVVVFLNRYDDALELHRLNRRWLTESAELEVFVDVDELVDILIHAEVQ
jgi:dethiobiotin synthetase